MPRISLLNRASNKGPLSDRTAATVVPSATNGVFRVVSSSGYKSFSMRPLRNTRAITGSPESGFLGTLLNTGCNDSDVVD
jgi:hypothetical protein